MTPTAPLTEPAPAKLNLMLHACAPLADGRHPLCSIFVALQLQDDVRADRATGATDTVECPGVDGENLATRALSAYRSSTPGDLPPLAIRIDKRIPVAGGLGGGSADAAAVLRAADRLASEPLGPDRLRSLAAELGADVPSQIEPATALVQGVGDELEEIELPPMAFVLAPGGAGLSTGEVYGELDRLRADGLAPERPALDPDYARRLARAPLPELATGLENDLEAAALSLRRELERNLAALRGAGALAARLTGSGPTAFGVFPDREAAEAAAPGIRGAMVTEPR